MENYEIWHDENKNDNTFWHGLLFVPVKSKSLLVDTLKKIRLQYGYDSSTELKFAGCLGKANRVSSVVCDNLTLFRQVLKVKSKKELFYKRDKEAKHLKEYSVYMELPDTFNCKFGLLKVSNNMTDMYNSMSYGEKVETTFRFISKCCLHSMFKDKEIMISKIIFDGYEHNNKAPDVERLFKGGLRDNIYISEDLEVDITPRKNRKDDSTLAVDFVDNIVGAMEAKFSNRRDSCNTLSSLNEIYTNICNKKIFCNPHSRWYKSIICSEVIFGGSNQDIKFVDLPQKSKDQFRMF